MYKQNQLNFNFKNDQPNIHESDLTFLLRINFTNCFFFALQKGLKTEILTSNESLCLIVKYKT